MGPRINDNGDLRAYSFYELRFNGRNYVAEYTGVVRHVRDGWEVRHPGRVGLSRAGRWAAFAVNSFSVPTLLLDLWTSAETVIPDNAELDSVADDGSLVSWHLRSFVVYRPGAEPRRYSLPFDAFGLRIDRYARYVAVYGDDGLWRVNLATGEVEPWVRQCDNCQVLDLGPDGASILYRQWSILYLAREPGSTPSAVMRQPELPVSDAALTDAGATIIASTPDGILGHDLISSFESVQVPGPTSFTREPAILAPGLWVRQEGSGLSAAEIRLDSSDVPLLWRSSSDIRWVVPADARLGLSTLAIGQERSPFAPATRTVDVQLAAPTFILQGDAGIGPQFFFNWPIAYHAATGRPVDFADPARPGESVDLVMTGLNGQGAATTWILSALNVDVYHYPVFESAAPSPDNAQWTVVRLKMPEALPHAICALGAIYGKSVAGALIITSALPK